MYAALSQLEESGIEEEIEALKSIYVRELQVRSDPREEYPITVHLNLHPATADIAKEQYVCLTLIVKIPKAYPESLPVFEIRNPRGLSDEDVDSIVRDLETKATSCRGSPMLYELIELAKEHLTVGNRPRCSCVICLYGFSDEDAFSRTECYHYFHSHCLRRYIEYVIAESKTIAKNPLDKDDAVSDGVKVLCPVCREAITYDLNALRAPPPIHCESASDFSCGSDLIRLQKQMAEGFLRQKSRGGIIDVEEEKNKFLLEISAVPVVADRRSGRGSRPRSEVGSERDDRQKTTTQSKDGTTPDRSETGIKVNVDSVPRNAGENAEPRGSGRPSQRGNRYRGGRKWGTNRFAREASGVNVKSVPSQHSEVSQHGLAQMLTSETNANRSGSYSGRGCVHGSVSRGRGQRGGRNQNGYRKVIGASETMNKSDSCEQKRDENVVDKLASEFSELNDPTKRTNVKSNGYRVRNDGRESHRLDRGKRTSSTVNTNSFRGHFSKNGSEETKPCSSSSNKVSSNFESTDATFVQLHERMVLTGPPCKSFSGAFSKPPPGFVPKLSAPPGFEAN